MPLPNNSTPNPGFKQTGSQTSSLPGSLPGYLPGNGAHRPRRCLLLMGTAYALGTFNDNFCKQAGSLLALTAGLNEIQGDGAILFALPFVLFSAWGGWLSDRLPKSRIAVWAKGMELLAMCLGAYSIIALNWGLLLLTVGLMGLQSTIFSPAINGAIPENFPAKDVPKVNAVLKVATTLTILLGIALGGYCLDQTWGQALLPANLPFGRVLVGLVAVFASLVGIVAVILLPRSQSANPKVKFPLLGPLQSLKDCYLLRHEPNLALVLAAEAFFYFISTLAVLLINDLGKVQLAYSYSKTATLSLALMIGICLGSYLAGRSTPLTWQKFMVPTALLMGGSLALAALGPFLSASIQFIWLMLIFISSGFAGGCYLIPLTSFIQVRPHPSEKGRVLGISGFVAFSGILLSGACYNFLILHTSPGNGLLFIGLFTMLTGLLWQFCKRKIQNSRFHISSSLARQPEAITLKQSVFKENITC